MPRTDALKKAQERYHGRLVQVKFWVNPDTEKDVLYKLNNVPNKAEYIKTLIQQDIEKGGE